MKHLTLLLLSIASWTYAAAASQIPDGAYILIQTGNPMHQLPVKAIISSNDSGTTISIPAYKIDKAILNYQGIGFHFTTTSFLESKAIDITTFVATASETYPSCFDGFYTVIRYGKNFSTNKVFEGRFILEPVDMVMKNAQQGAAANP
jgi:hypothetical protein